MLGHLEEAGVQTVDVKTTFQDMNDPMKALLRLTLEGLIRHDGNPVLRWSMGNVEAAERGQQIRPVKPKNAPKRKIDPSVAVINAMRGAVGGETEVHVGELLTF